MPTFNDARVRLLNTQAVNRSGDFVLYWIQSNRRLTHNHALDYAIHWANQLRKPLVVYEALKLNYPWANARIHRFILEGMAENTRVARRRGLNYWPFVETPGQSGRGLVRSITQKACLLVTDDFPGFIIPAQNRAIAAAVNVAAHAIDGNGLIPLTLLGKSCSAAAHLRPRIHKLFADSWGHRAGAEPVVPRGKVDPPFDVWNAPDDLAMFVRSLPVDQSVKPVPQTPGGSTPALQLLNTFVSKKLTRYAGERSQPGDPTTRAASGLSPYLHFGHLSMQQVCEVVLGDDWTPKEINPKTRNKDDFYCRDANVNAFLDEAITWRDLGYHWHHCRNAEVGMRNAESKTQSWDEGKKPSFNFETMDFSPRSRGTLETVLPPWALASLRKHASDPREHVYSLEEWEAGATHDPLWNAAQTELVHTGTIHNYLRMLWGKKVLEWSATPEEGYDTLEYLNNKYALDGRDPNSYTGILWCFGLFDRPWPERDVFGVIRYMSSANTAKKFPLKGYLDYVRTLARGTRTLFDDEK